MTDEHAQEIATAWLDAWNRHDLEAILEHYTEDVIFTSPFVEALLGNPSGTIQGKAALRDYFSQGLAAYPDLQFTKHQVLAGVDSLVIYYRSVKDLWTAEMMQIGPEGLVTRVMAHYRSEA